MTAAEVFLAGRHAGSLSYSGPVVRFRYAEEYLDTDGATPLSLSLPLRREPHPQRPTRAWMEGLLPSSLDVRRRLGAQFGVKPHDPLALLVAIGLDCPGAVQITRPGEAPVDAEGWYEEVDEAQIAQRVRALRRDEAGWVIADERWSLGGAQGKFTLHRGPNGWEEPKGSAASTHIVKLGTNRARLSALNEHVCLQTYRLLGLPAASTEVMDVDGEPVIIVERFDRLRSAGGPIRRLHQEDLCQALANQFAYTADGGPRPDEIIGLLSARPASRDRFVRQLLANLLIGSPDGHARNYSLLLRGDSFTLSPAYDVASSLPYDAIRDSHDPMHLRSVAMPVAGERSFHAITGRHWSDFLGHNRLDAERWLDELRRLAVLLPERLAEVLDGSDQPEFRERMLGRVGDNCRAVVANLARR